MKRSVVFVVFFLILGFAVAGLYWSQRRPKSSPVSANAILNMAADAQRDLSRVPMRLTRLSDEREIRIGKDLASRYATQTRNLTPEEEGLEKYVTRVGGTVALRAHRHLPYTFTVLPDHNLINAFSLPGGPVYIGEGMLDLITSEDELANILAHEIEHIDHYHCVERVQVEAKLKDLNLDVLGALLQLPLDFWEAGYHKDEEFEVDREVVRRIRHPRAKPGPGAFRAGHSELERLFPFTPAPFRASRRSQPPHRPGALGNSQGAEAVPRRV